MWRKIKIFLGLYIIINLIVGYIYWPRIDQFLRFMPRVAPASFSEPANALDAQKQDLSYLETVLDYDRSYSPSAREAFQSRISALQSDQQGMTEAEFYLSVRELMAMADNGHTSAASGPAFRAFNRSGADLYYFSDGYYVVRAQKDHRDLVGQKVLAIDGQPIDQIISSLRKYTGGPNNWRDMQSLYFVRSPELLHAAGLSKYPDQLHLTLADVSGTIHQVQLKAMAAVAKSDEFRNVHMTLSPEALTEEGDNWVRVFNTDDDLAHYLKGMHNGVSSHKLGGGLYVSCNDLMGSSEFPVKQMLLQTLNNVPEGGYDFLIVDLRWNQGGDFGNSVPFTRQAKSVLAEGGKIYVVTSANTFSAAIVFSAMLKQSAPEDVMIIGEEMGDRPQFWSERGKPFTLPNSGYWINYATAYHDWETSCDKVHEFCFPPNKRYNQDIERLELDYLIAPSFTDYASGRDIVMDWIEAHQVQLR